MNMEQLVEWELPGETGVLAKILPQFSFPTTGSTRTSLRLSPGSHDVKPGTDRPSYNTAHVNIVSAVTTFRKFNTNNFVSTFQSFLRECSILIDRS
jgi:hypothetical protein